MRDRSMAEWRCGLLHSDCAHDTVALQVSEFELTPNERYFLRLRADQGLAARHRMRHMMRLRLTYRFHVTRGLELMSSVWYVTSS